MGLLGEGEKRRAAAAAHPLLMTRRLRASGLGAKGAGGRSEALTEPAGPPDRSAFLTCSCTSDVMLRPRCGSASRRRQSSANAGACVMAWRTEFMKQVLPRLRRPAPTGRACRHCCTTAASSKSAGAGLGRLAPASAWSALARRFCTARARLAGGWWRARPRSSRTHAR